MARSLPWWLRLTSCVVWWTVAVSEVSRTATAQPLPAADKEPLTKLPAPNGAVQVRDAARANGETPGSNAGSANTRTAAPEIELHAGHVEIEGPFNRFRLSNGVELTVHRYRVTADRLTLDRTPQGIVVEGEGQVAFCPCASSPLTVGFTRATVAPPTDLLLRNTTFRSCGVPVFWLPAYWVRSPNKVGLLTPMLAWRAAEGPLIGTGIHVPLSDRADSRDNAIDLTVGSYLRGGADLGLFYRTSRSTTYLRWDHFQRDLLEVSASGFRHLEQRSSLAWQIDSLRGSRGRVGPVGFEIATRSYDRLRAEYAVSDASVLYALGVQGDVARATPLAQWGTLGPATRWGVGAALGEWGHVDSLLTVIGRARQANGAEISALHASRFGFDLRPGPMVVRAMLHERWLVGSGAESVHDAGLVGSELRLSTPLVGNWGRGAQRTDHWFEPIVLGTAAWRGYGAAHEQRPGSVTSLQLGVINKIGRLGSPMATSFQLRIGEVVSELQPTRIVAGRWLSSGEWVAFGGDLAWSGSAQWLSTLRSRIGRLDRLSVRSRLEGRGTAGLSEARWLFDEAWSPWYETWYSRPGWLTSEDLNLALGYQVALNAGLAYDVSNRAFVAEYGGASYRHPCGCLASSVTSHWRAGRGGWDVTLLLDLMP